MAPRTTKTPAKTGKKAKNKGKTKGKINLKGWLETPADWQRFDAWAAVNAQPRKIPEPDPIVRLTKPLSQMKKRIQVLSQPTKKSDTSAICRLDWSVSKAALKAKPSKHIKALAKFIEKEAARCREFPIKIRKAALRYEPSDRIIEISRPSIRISKECKTLEVSQKALKHETTAKERMLALAKKAIECPDSLTSEERDELMTPTGIMKSALTYKFTPWMSLLSLPSYRFLKDRNDETATAWKNKILEESRIRGKKALREKRRKEEKEREKKKKELARKEKEIEEGTGDVKEADKTEVEEKKDEAGEQENEPQGTTTEGETQKEQTEPQDEVIQGQESAEGNEKEDSKLQEMKPKKRRKRRIEEVSEDNGEDDEEAKRRWEERNAWRFTPSSCKELGVRRSALKGKVPPNVDILAKPNIREDKACKANPFGVKKSALSASASARISVIAKPNHPRDPVERAPPREKDDFGRPIFPLPVYGKVLPEFEYKEAECRTEENDEKKSKKSGEKEQSLDPIAFGPSIDPLADPRRAKKQQEERKKLAQIKQKSRDADE